MEFALMVDAGMRPGAALLAGTSNAARLLGLDAEIGTLTPGKWADIVAVPGNPVTDIRATEHPSFVMQRGRILRRTGVSLDRKSVVEGKRVYVRLDLGGRRIC